MNLLLVSHPTALPKASHPFLYLLLAQSFLPYLSQGCFSLRLLYLTPPPRTFGLMHDPSSTRSPPQMGAVELTACMGLSTNQQRSPPTQRKVINNDHSLIGQALGPRPVRTCCFVLSEEPFNLSTIARVAVPRPSRSCCGTLGGVSKYPLRPLGVARLDLG